MDKFKKGDEVMCKGNPYKVLSSDIDHLFLITYYVISDGTKRHTVSEGELSHDLIPNIA